MSKMIKLILEITRNNLFKTKKSERSPQNPSRISCQRVLITRKISGTFYTKFRKKYMKFEENNEEIEGNSTRNLKEKHREFFTRIGDAKEGSVEEKLLFLAVEEAWLYASLGCIISAAVLFSGRPFFLFWQRSKVVADSGYLVKFITAITCRQIKI